MPTEAGPFPLPVPPGHSPSSSPRTRPASGRPSIACCRRPCRPCGWASVHPIFPLPTPRSCQPRCAVSSIWPPPPPAQMSAPACLFSGASCGRCSTASEMPPSSGNASSAPMPLPATSLILPPLPLICRWPGWPSSRRRSTGGRMTPWRPCSNGVNCGSPSPPIAAVSPTSAPSSSVSCCSWWPSLAVRATPCR